VHIGDGRAYLLRGGELIQLTQDHTYVQSLVDQGKLSAEEAASHPERALLVRALGAGAGQVEADLALPTALVAIATCSAPTDCPPSSTAVGCTRH
jgi:PPM family protein phosphatase